MTGLLHGPLVIEGTGTGGISSHHRHRRGAPAHYMVGGGTPPPIGRRGVGSEAHAAK